MEIYLLDWTATKHGKQPQPSEVKAWLEARGFEVGAIKVYGNGNISIECAPSPASDWQHFAPMPAAPADALASAVRDLLKAKMALERVPEHRRTPVEAGLLAAMQLILIGYGVENA